MDFLCTQNEFSHDLHRITKNSRTYMLKFSTKIHEVFQITKK